MFFKLGSAPLLNVFDDLGINLLEEFIGLSQYLFDVLVFESLLHDVAFLPDYQLAFHEIWGSEAQLSLAASLHPRSPPRSICTFETGPAIGQIAFHPSCL